MSSDLWLDLKNDRNSFVIIFDALLNAAYRVSLRCPGVELEGKGVQTPRPGVFGAEHRHGAGRVTCTYLHCEYLGDLMYKFFWKPYWTLTLVGMKYSLKISKILNDIAFFCYFNLFSFFFFEREENEQKLRAWDMYMDYWRGLYPTPKLLEGSGPPRPLLWRSPWAVQ